MCYTMVYKLIQVSLGINMFKNILSSSILKCKHIMFSISMLNNIFSLHTNTQNYHLKYPNILC